MTVAILLCSSLWRHGFCCIFRHKNCLAQVVNFGGIIMNEVDIFWIIALVIFLAAIIAQIVIDKKKKNRQ